MENSERIAELKNAANLINGELTFALSTLSGLRGEMKLPEAVEFSGGEKLDSFPEKNIEKVIRDGVGKRQIFFAVNPDFSGQVFDVRRIEVSSKDSEKGMVILALFPENFLQRCDINGIKPQDALRKCLARVMFEDVKIQAQKHTRGSLQGSLTGLVGIFRGKIASS